jgi:hypothetical protein
MLTIIISISRMGKLRQGVYVCGGVGVEEDKYITQLSRPSVLDSRINDPFDGHLK